MQHCQIREKKLVNLHNLEKTCTYKIKHAVQNFWLSTYFTGKFGTFLMLNNVITVQALSVSEHLEQNKKINLVVTRSFVVVSRTYQFWLERKTLTPVYPKKTAEYFEVQLPSSSMLPHHEFIVCLPLYSIADHDFHHLYKRSLILEDRICNLQKHPYFDVGMSRWLAFLQQIQ